MGSREERIARNEALFREVNERIKDVSETHAAPEESEFLCECGDKDCTQPIKLTLPEYEDVRRDPTHFAVAQGHVAPEIERVVAETARFTVVEKTAPEAAEIAASEDPRS